MPIVVAGRCGLPHSFTIRAVELHLRGKSRPCFIYLFVFVVSRTFPPNIATCDSGSSRQESECRFNTSLLYLFLVVSMENSGCTEINTQHRCFGFVCLFYPPQSLHVVMVWFSFNSKQTHLPANLNIIRGHYWKISRQTE